jgi:predicted RND superfamily exporter protein
MSQDQPNLSHRFADFLVTYRWHMMVASVVLAALAIIPARNVVMDRSISSMFAKDNPLMPPFRKMERVFEGNEIVLAVYEDSGLFDPSGDGLARLKEIRDRLAAVEGVKGVLGIDMIIGDRVLDRDTLIPARVRHMFLGFTHGADGTTTAIGCILKPINETTATRSETIAELRAEIATLPDGLQPGTLTGEPVLIEDAFSYIDEDGQRLFVITTVLLSLVIFICFRSLRWVVVPIAVVLLALLFTHATVGLLQIKISMVSSMLTAVITVIGVATVVHVIIRFRGYRFAGHDAETALRKAAQTLVVPVFWACVTDAVGFAALMFADVGPIRDFGLMMALGSLMVLVSAALLIPGLALFGRRPSDPKRAWGEQSLDANLLNIAGLVYRHPWWVGIGALGVALVAIYGIRWLEIETDFTRNFRSSTPVVKSYELVESKLGGAGVLDIVIPAPEPLTWDYMRKVLILENDLRKNVLIVDEDGNERRGLNKTLSLADVVLSLSPKHPGKVRRLVRSSYVRTGLKTMHKKIPSFCDALYGSEPDTAQASSPPGNGEGAETAEQHYFRVMLRATERQPSAQKKQIIEQVQSITTAHFPDAEVTGYFALLTGLIDSILRDQWKTFGIALLGIFLTMAIAFRSLRFALIATFPNAMPILMVNGMMGWLGWNINMGGAMIAAVSMGLSIDSSIHYLMAYSRARKSGMSLNAALNEVQQTVGRAMVFSTLALIVGFAAMATSQFVPTIYFGVLVSISMLGALFGNLVWLPLLLRVFQPNVSIWISPATVTAAMQKG